MRVEDLRQLLSRQPFQPFVVHVAGVRSLEVRHAEFALLSPDGRTLYVFETEFTHLIDVNAITMASVRGKHSSIWERAQRQVTG